ncbi:MAG: DUF4004 family protein [Bacilli bacterium]|nr:DUF4004 family protein [Bacilli bacterium]
MISKKDLLKEMNISYGQLYRWKREGLIPDEWFNKQAVSTGQETFFKRDLIIPRIKKILSLKDKYQLDELKEFFNPSIEGRKFSLREVIVLEEIDPFVLKMYSTKHDTFTITELAVLSIFSNNLDVINFDDYQDIDFKNHKEINHYFYILYNGGFFVLIGPEDIVIDKKLNVYKKINIEDVVSKLASSLKE